jgi:hypothetical protein
VGDLARPALPEALAALTGSHVDEWRGRFDIRLGAYHGSGRGAGNVLCLPWTTTDPTDAAEMLVTRGVLPEGWHGDTRRYWACSGCGGRGEVTEQTAGGLVEYGCPKCSVDPDARGTGLVARPRTIPDLVAVASLGWPAIQRAEELARAACHALREYGCPTPERVVWRVGYRLLPGDFAWRLHGSYGVQRDGAASFPGGITGPVRPVAALWAMGLALDRITRDAVVVVVPPVGGAL